MGADAGEIGLLKKSMHGNAILATAHEKLDISAGIQLEESVSSWRSTESRERHLVTTSCSRDRQTR